MKKLLLLGSLALCVGAFGQNGRGIRQAAAINGIPSSENIQSARMGHGNNQTMSMTCIDTVRYPLAKQQILFPALQFSIFSVWQSDNEAVSQTFQHTGGSITISGIEFYGANNTTDGMPSVTVQASVYNVNGSNVPTTLLGSGTVSFTSATAGYHYVTLGAPVTVTGNYAIVLQATNAGGILDFYGTNLTPGQTMDEGLSRYRSNYYPGSGGTYVNFVTLTTGDATNFPGGPYDIEPLVAPILSYGINTAFTATPNPVCAGSAVTISNTTTPTGLLQNRMYNFGTFMNYFNQWPQDSLYVWDMGDGSAEIWDVNTSYTYSTAGTYTVDMVTLGGLWNSCPDLATSATITVNAAPSNAFSFSGGNTFCASGANPVPTAVSPGGIWTGSLGLVLANGATGEIDLTSTPAGTYTLTYAAAGACASGSSNQVVTVSNAPDATFSYASMAYCTGTANPTVTLGGGASAGTFSALPAGLNFVSASTGEINMGTSAAGTYTITNSIAASGSCPAASSTYTVTINETPVVSAISSQTYCNGDAAPITTVTVSIPASYGWSNSNTSIGLGANSPGDVPSFTATNTGSTPITATVSLLATANGCFSPAVTYTITVNPAPAVSFTTLPSSVCVNASDFALTGATPAGGNYSGTGVSAGMFSPATAGAGTYSITYSYTDGSTNCSGSASASITVDPCIGLKNVSDAGSIAVYPNPAKNQVTFSLAKNMDKAEISICTVEGKVVYKAEFSGSKGTIDVSAFARGLYFVRVKADNTESMTKLMID